MMTPSAMSAGEAVVGRWRLPRGWHVWPQWVLACAVGGAAAAGLATVGGWAGVALFGVAAALPQWLVLRSHVADAWWWVPLTVFGVLVALPIAFMVGSFVVLVGFYLGLWVVPLPHSVGASPVEVNRGVLDFEIALLIASVIAGAVAGAVVGAVQLLVLRRLGQAADRWLVASLRGGSLVGYPTYLMLKVAAAPSILAGASLPPSMLGMVLGSILAMALGGTAYGLITGAVLARLVPHSAPGRMGGLVPAAPHHEP